MQLSAELIHERLSPLPPGVPKNYLSLVREGKIPHALEEALTHGRIIIDPFPDEESLLKRFGPVTLDFTLGPEVEIPRIPLQLATIDGRKVIRRYTYDERAEDQYRLVENMMGTRPAESPTRMRIKLERDQTLELTSNMLIVGYTEEILCLPTDLVGHVNGKSHHARHGLKNHMTAPRFDPGFVGYPALEMSTENGAEGINIFPGMVIAAFEFTKLEQPAGIPYFRKARARFSGQH